jgi:hypothetical protein
MELKTTGRMPRLRITSDLKIYGGVKTSQLKVGVRCVRAGVLALVVAVPLRAVGQEKPDAGGSRTETPPIALKAMNTPEETIGCPVGWQGKAYVTEAAGYEGWCYDKHRWFESDRGGHWADMEVMRLDIQPKFTGLAQYLRTLQACDGGTRYGWCGKIVGTMKVDGQKATILQPIPDDAQSASETKPLQLIFPEGNRVYSIELYAPKEQFDDLMPYFSTILASFHVK